MAGLSWPAYPAWLAALQRDFGQALRTPLDRSSGTLCASTTQYSPELVNGVRTPRDLAAAERLAVYNRQYWFRLFTILQRAYPLVARLLGFWRFNRDAAAFLLERPPTGWDIDAIVPAFQDYLSRALPAEQIELDDPQLDGPRRSLPARALREAVELDAAHHRVVRAPPSVEYRPTADDAERLLTCRLRLSPAAAIVTESWSLCELRQQALGAPDASSLKLGPPLSRPRDWLLLRQQVAVSLSPLEPGEAALLRLLALHPVGAALAELETSYPQESVAELPERARTWLARSVQLGIWTGLDAVP